MFLKRGTRSLTLCQTPLSPPGLLFSSSSFSSSSSVYHLSPPGPKLFCLASRDWRPITPESSDTISCQRECRQPRGCLANPNTCILSSVWLLSLVPSIPLPSASLSIIHLTLIFLPVCQRELGPTFLQPGEACAYSVHVYVCTMCECVCFFFWWSERGGDL